MPFRMTARVAGRAPLRKCRTVMRAPKEPADREARRIYRGRAGRMVDMDAMPHVRNKAPMQRDPVGLCAFPAREGRRVLPV